MNLRPLETLLIQESALAIARPHTQAPKRDVCYPQRGSGLKLALERAIKRTFDITVAGLGMALALPLGLVIALGVKLTSRGPVFFCQDQLGEGDTCIRPLKFRSMRVGGEEILQRILAEGGPLAEEYRQFHKMQNDPRVTPVGRFLRKTSLDELPQLWNILKGEMSMVGPRPYLPREQPYMVGKDIIIRRMKPGLTGYWQVNGRNETTFAERVEMDAHYVRNWSLKMDLKLFLATFRAVLLSRGAC